MISIIPASAQVVQIIPFALGINGLWVEYHSLEIGKCNCIKKLPGKEVQLCFLSVLKKEVYIN